MLGLYAVSARCSLVENTDLCITYAVTVFAAIIRLYRTEAVIVVYTVSYLLLRRSLAYFATLIAGPILRNFSGCTIFRGPPFLSLPSPLLPLGVGPL